MASRRFASTDDLFLYLMDFVNVEKGQATVFKLDRMADLAALLGNPQAGRLTVHVAGSKGKGSVSAMVASILEASGRKTGLYTSPHLMRWKERITLAGKEIPEDLLLDAAGEVIPLVEGRGPGDFAGGELPTYFELTTLIAFCAFRLAGCVAQVLETGLGGRLDSTNIVDPDLSVITPIELEHTQYLGDTVVLIAGEKAGIIKRGKPVCVSPQKPEVMEVFRRTAAGLDSRLLEADRLVRISDVRISAEGTDAILCPGPEAPEFLVNAFGRDPLPVHSPMAGTIQASNMALAALAAASVFPGSPRRSIIQGLARASLPARFEILRGLPVIVLDGAHTPASAEFALQSFTALFPGPRVLLFGCAHDKHHAEMAAILGPAFDEAIITRPGTFKQSDPERVFESFRRMLPNTRFVPDTARAVMEAAALARERGAALLVTGSFYLCAEVKSVLDIRDVRQED